MNNCPNCEYHKARALRLRDEAYKHAGITLPEPPPECQTDAEKTAFAFGWFKAMAAESEIYKLQQEPVAWASMYLNGNIGVVTWSKDTAKEWASVGHVIKEMAFTSPPAQRKPWVGLTFEDKGRVLANDFGGSRSDCMDEAEKILREKNA